jgi:hypothetical protein
VGRGNARFGCPNGTYRIDEHSALHYHVYVDYGDINDQDGLDAVQQDVVKHIKATCSAYSFFEYPEGKWLDKSMLVIAESTSYGIAVADNEWSQAVFVYARECDEKEDFLTQGVFNLACRLFWDMRHFRLRRRSCAWTSRDYCGLPTST